MDIVNWIITQINANQFFSGVIGGGILGSILYYLKEIPLKIFKFIKYLFTTRLSIVNDDSLFIDVNKWLDEIIDRKYVRNLRISSVSQDDEDKLILSPGIGNHIILYKNRPIFVNRNRINASDNSSNQKAIEEITITVLGRNDKIILNIINDIQSYFNRSDVIKVYLYNHPYWSYQHREKRSLDTIFIKTNIKSKIILDIKNFISSQKWYNQHGIPYHRGYLFHGEPGTGKTSFASAIASELNWSIYYICLDSFQTNSNMISAFLEIKKKSIIIIEDIDTSKLAKNREDNNITDSKLSLSTFLNLIDGILASENRIIIFTTNHLDKIDSAIKRDGRIDIIEYIGPLEQYEIFNMILSFNITNIELNEINPNIKIPGATLQNILIKNKDKEKILYEINSYNK